MVFLMSDDVVVSGTGTVSKGSKTSLVVCSDEFAAVKTGFVGVSSVTIGDALTDSVVSDSSCDIVILFRSGKRLTGFVIAGKYFCTVSSELGFTKELKKKILFNDLYCVRVTNYKSKNSRSLGEEITGDRGVCASDSVTLSLD